MSNLKWKPLVVCGLLGLSAFGLLGNDDCSDESQQQKTSEAIRKEAGKREVYKPIHGGDYSNFDRKLRYEDQPDTIIWCSIMPQASTSPIITVPIQQKLTSSSVSNLPGSIKDDSGDGTAVVPGVSNDGLYHGDPPPYRFGFTPGGQLVDFSGLPVFCSTKPLNFQKDSIEVTNSGLSSASAKAEQALKDGNNAEAQKILDSAVGE